MINLIIKTINLILFKTLIYLFYLFKNKIIFKTELSNIN